MEKGEEVDQFDDKLKMSDCPKIDKVVQEAKDLKKNCKKVIIEAECLQNMEQLEKFIT